MSNGAASSLALAGPTDSRSRTFRRVGLDKALKTASVAADGTMSDTFLLGLSDLTEGFYGHGILL